MSFGVITSRPGRLMIEATGEPFGSGSDLMLADLQVRWGPVWSSGRVTLTRLHLNFTPGRTVRGTAAATLDLDLRDVASVELSGGRLSRQILVRTEGHLVRVRVRRASSIATTLTDVVRAARDVPRRTDD